MKLSLKQLKAFYPALPEDLHALLDDVGLEVKRVNETGDDTIFTLELLANRGDHLSYWGVATELAGRLGGSVKMPPLAKLKKGKTSIRVTCETDKCLQYSATELVVDNLTKPFSSELLAVLEAADIHSIDAAVDATNIVNLTLGQPTHLFDADKITGGITIRLSKPGEIALPLFADKPISLPSNTMVIADDEKILAIAGLIGCEESKVTASTKKMILESATFDPVTTRKAGRALSIQTDSSARFERGADPVMMLIAVNRIVWLLEKFGVAHATSAINVVGHYHHKPKVITVDSGFVAHYLNLPKLSAKEMKTRLERYGFSVAIKGKKLHVTVPSHRMWDVEAEPDIYEELARSIGYDNLPTTLPRVEQGARLSHAETIKSRVNDLLIGLGTYEIFTDGFYGRDVLEKLNLKEGDALYTHVEVLNALDRGYSLLKRSCLPQAVIAVANNLRFQTMNMKLFEWTRIFVPEQHADHRICHELPQLWMMVNGVEGAINWNQIKRPMDVYYLKGVVEALAKSLKLPLEIKSTNESLVPVAKFLHPYRQAEVLLNDKVVGIFGEVHSLVCKAFEIKRQRPCYLELNVEALLTAKDFIAPTQVDLPAQLPINRNIAFTLPEKFEAMKVVALIKEEAPDYLETINIVDLFEHKENDQPVRTVTYEFIFNNERGELTADDVNQQLTHFISLVESKSAAKLRG